MSREAAKKIARSNAEPMLAVHRSTIEIVTTTKRAAPSTTTRKKSPRHSTTSHAPWWTTALWRHHRVQPDPKPDGNYVSYLAIELSGPIWCPSTTSASRTGASARNNYERFKEHSKPKWPSSAELSQPRSEQRRPSGVSTDSG